MADCCDDDDPHPLETLPAGLPVIPRQLAGFPDIRQRLLERLADPDAVARRQALGRWRPYSDDFGSLGLELWAYVADVLGFYDERVANESYLGTAVRRASLRRLVELPGYHPRPGIAGTVTLAAIADGVVAVTVPPATGFRARGFDGHPPQVFENTSATVIHPALNRWEIPPFRRRPTVDDSFFLGDTQAAGSDKEGGKAGSGENRVNRLLFLPGGFGLAELELCLIEARPGATFDEQVTRVGATEPFAGRDGKSYTRATLTPAITIAEDVDLSTLRARRPTQKVVATVNAPVGESKSTPAALGNVDGVTRLYVDGPPTAFRVNDPMIVARNLDGEDADFRFVRIDSITAAAVTIGSIPPATFTDANGVPQVIPSPQVVATELRLSPALTSAFLVDEAVSFHHGFVEGGQPTNVCRTSVTAAELAAPGGVPVTGPVQLPLDSPDLAARIGAASGGDGSELESRFLLQDAEARGALIDGRLNVASDGAARFEALVQAQITTDTLRLPLTLYGNPIEASRGESVRGEVLGSGDPRLAHQRFKLGKSPLTYLPGAVTGSGNLQDSTLTVRVDGIAWRAVPGFFGCGPADQVFIVRHDDRQNGYVTFGDGVRGARVPAGVGNVVADYRFGAGEAAPPAGAIRQLAGAVKGLRGVRSPIAAAAGRDPDSPEDLRGAAPKSALLLGRAVSAVDFEALARNAPGVIRAKADWLWIPEQFQPGVVVHIIGDTDAATLTMLLSEQADPTIPIAVSVAEPIVAQLTLAIATDPRFVAADVAAEVAEVLANGILSPAQAVIGETFWPTTLYTAAAGVPGVVSVTALDLHGDEAALLPDGSGGTCLPTGRYLDFSAPDAITVSAAVASGLPPVPGQKGAAP